MKNVEQSEFFFHINKAIPCESPRKNSRIRCLKIAEWKSISDVLTHLLRSQYSLIRQDHHQNAVNMNSVLMHIALYMMGYGYACIEYTKAKGNHSEWVMSGAISVVVICPIANCYCLCARSDRKMLNLSLRSMFRMHEQHTVVSLVASLIQREPCVIINDCKSIRWNGRRETKTICSHSLT